MSLHFITGKRSCLGCKHFEGRIRKLDFDNEVQCKRDRMTNRWISEERKVPTWLAYITESCGKSGIYYTPNEEFKFKPKG